MEINGTSTLLLGGYFFYNNKLFRFIYFFFKLSSFLKTFQMISRQTKLCSESFFECNCTLVKNIKNNTIDHYRTPKSIVTSTIRPISMFHPVPIFSYHGYT